MDVTGCTNCHKCHRAGYFVTTPEGGDYSTCPLCDTLVTRDNLVWDDDVDTYNKNMSRISRATEGTHDGFDYCEDCQILYTTGHVHAMEGCTSSIYYASFITAFVDKQGNKFQRMPRFQTLNDARRKIKKMQVIQTQCTCGGYSFDCDKAYYKKTRLRTSCIKISKI